jgi:hypothetical protein
MKGYLNAAVSSSSTLTTTTSDIVTTTSVTTTTSRTPIMSSTLAGLYQNNLQESATSSHLILPSSTSQVQTTTTSAATSPSANPASQGKLPAGRTLPKLLRNRSQALGKNRNPVTLAPSLWDASPSNGKEQTGSKQSSNSNTKQLKSSVAGGRSRDDAIQSRPKARIVRFFS